VFARFPSHLFRRVTSGGSVLAELDGLRAVAIVPVVLFHATLSLYLKGVQGQVSSITGDSDVFRSPLGWMIGHGFLGVQLFFVISGFVVTLPFARARLLGERPPSLGKYYLKRLTRIEPPYVIALATFLCGALLVAPQNVDWRDYLSGLVYLRTALFGHEPWAFFISWSLELEVQFYLLAPVVVALFWIRPHALRRGVFAVLLAATAVLAARARLSGAEPAPIAGPLQHGSWLGTEAVFFLTGMLAADFWTLREIRDGARTSSLSWDGLWLLGFAAATASYRVLESTPWGIALLVVGLFLMMLGAFRSRIIRAALSIPIVSIIGGACYTIYLFHFLLVSMFGRFLAPWTTQDFERNVLLIALPFSVAVIAACLCLFPVVERPFMFGDWPRRAWRWIRGRAGHL
jgi:peptidoglycan/LPS O-acetylase OafA/YrhL